MGLIEITLIGVGLAMDAVAVSISNAMIFKPIRKTDFGIWHISGDYAAAWVLCGICLCQMDYQI